MKQLRLSTALVAAASLAGAAQADDRLFDLEVRGYSQLGLAGIVDAPEGNPANEANGVVFGSDAEVHFRGQSTLDNGLTIAFRAELELEDDSNVDRADGDLLDEIWAQVTSIFGRLKIGMEDGAPDQMIYSSPNVFRGTTISSIDLNPFEPYTAPDLSSPASQLLGSAGVFAGLDTSPDFTDDYTKVTYLSPRIAGVQLGLSYTPNPCRNDTGLGLDSDAGVNGTTSCGNADTFGNNYWEVAGNFEWKMASSGLVLGVSASYGRGGEGQVVDNLNVNPTEWHIGGNVRFAGFTVGGAYKKTDNLTIQNEGVNGAKGTHFDLGLAYETGPWTIGGAYGEAETSGIAVNQELTLIIGGVSYKLGPGIAIGVGAIYGDADVGTSTDEGTAIFTELDLQF